MLVVNKQIKTIKSRREFIHLFKRGKKFHVSHWITLNYKTNELGYPRFGWTLPKYVGTAVTRNRIRRWCREIVRDVIKEIPHPCSVDINIVLRKYPRDLYKSIEYGKFKKLLQPTLQKIIR